jgi:hypothetical protein
MSHDGATAGNDAAVTRSDYGHRRPDPPSAADHPRGESEYRRESRYFEGLGAARRFGRAGTRAELLRLLMLPDFDRADRIGEFWSYPESRNFAEHSSTAGRIGPRGRAGGMLREAGR